MKVEEKINIEEAQYYIRELSKNLDALIATGDAVQTLSADNPLDGLGVSVQQLAGNSLDHLGNIEAWLTKNGLYGNKNIPDGEQTGAS